MAELETPRLRLRSWKDSDHELFFKLNSNAQVMEFFPKTLSREESDAAIARYQGHLDEHGFGFWATELKTTREFIGVIGLAHVTFPAPFTPCIEVGWRLDHRYWGHGYAPEGALACLQFAFQTLKPSRIVSFTAVENARSRKVMEKIGMHHVPSLDFDHPKVEVGHPLRRHVFYQIDSLSLI